MVPPTKIHSVLPRPSLPITTSTRHPQPKGPHQLKPPNCIQGVKQNYDNLNDGGRGGCHPWFFDCMNISTFNLHVRSLILFDACINFGKQTLFFMSPQGLCATPAKSSCLTHNHCLGDRNHFLEVLQRFAGRLATILLQALQPCFGTSATIRWKPCKRMLGPCKHVLENLQPIVGRLATLFGEAGHHIYLFGRLATVAILARLILAQLGSNCRAHTACRRYW